ncbi:hypothetical protein V8E36_001131 [Tilletia maclaganii]
MQLLVKATAVVVAIAAIIPVSARVHAAPPAHQHRDIALGRDASTLMSGGTNNEGEDHGPLSIPQGATLRNITIGNSNDELVVYWPDSTKNKQATAAFVMIHGRIRNGNEYWTVINDALQSALKDGVDDVDPNTIVVAPQFFSTIFNKGQYTNNQLAWADVNAWQAGETATHPTGTRASSFDALDAFIDEFSDTSKYPNMRNLTLVGHGGGGQLMARYAMVGKDTPNNLWIRYIIGDPSSNAYFTKHRPKDVPKSVASKSTCPDYNQWRYGYDNFTTYTGLRGKPFDFYSQYIKRDVIQIIGYQDVDASGDQYCMAMLQGGSKRRDRNLSWWKYINTLARTNFDVSGFPGEFPSLPDWSNASQHEIAHRLIVVEDADHDAALVFGGAEGRAALFSSTNLPTGWRPDGWKAQGTGQYTVGSSDGGDGTAGSGKAPSTGSGKSPVAGGGSGNSSSSSAGASGTGAAGRRVVAGLSGGSLMGAGAAVSALLFLGGAVAPL